MWFSSHRWETVGRGAVGLALDYVNRRLYYSNIGSVTVDSDAYSWHKLETVRLDDTSQPVTVRTIVSSYADLPRAITVDPSTG